VPASSEAGLIRSTVFFRPGTAVRVFVNALSQSSLAFGWYVKALGCEVVEAASHTPPPEDAEGAAVGLRGKWEALPSVKAFTWHPAKDSPTPLQAVLDALKALGVQLSVKDAWEELEKVRKGEGGDEGLALLTAGVLAERWKEDAESVASTVGLKPKTIEWRSLPLMLSIDELLLFPVGSRIGGLEKVSYARAKERFEKKQFPHFRLLLSARRRKVFEHGECILLPFAYQLRLRNADELTRELACREVWMTSGEVEVKHRVHYWLNGRMPLPSEEWFYVRPWHTAAVVKKSQ